MDQVHRVEGCEVLQRRGETVALIRLGQIFGVKSECGNHSNGKVVLLRVGQKRVAVLVDQLLGQESTVVKSLGAYLRQ